MWSSIRKPFASWRYMSSHTCHAIRISSPPPINWPIHNRSNTLTRTTEAIKRTRFNLRHCQKVRACALYRYPQLMLVNPIVSPMGKGRRMQTQSRWRRGRLQAHSPLLSGHHHFNAVESPSTVALLTAMLRRRRFEDHHIFLLVERDRIMRRTRSSRMPIHFVSIELLGHIFPDSIDQQSWSYMFYFECFKISGHWKALERWNIRLPLRDMRNCRVQHMDFMYIFLLLCVTVAITSQLRPT